MASNHIAGDPLFDWGGDDDSDKGTTMAWHAMMVGMIMFMMIATMMVNILPPHLCMVVGMVMVNIQPTTHLGMSSLTLSTYFLSTEYSTPYRLGMSVLAAATLAGLLGGFAVVGTISAIGIALGTLSLLSLIELPLTQYHGNPYLPNAVWAIVVGAALGGIVMGLGVLPLLPSIGLSAAFIVVTLLVSIHPFMR